MQDPVLGEGTICFRILSNSSHISTRLSLVVCLGALARASGCFPWEQLFLVTLPPPGSITSLSTFFEVGIPISLSEVTQCRLGLAGPLPSFEMLGSAPLPPAPRLSQAQSSPPQQPGSPTSPLHGVPSLAKPCADKVLFYSKHLLAQSFLGGPVSIPRATVTLKNMQLGVHSVRG